MALEFILIKCWVNTVDFCFFFDREYKSTSLTNKKNTDRKNFNFSSSEWDLSSVIRYVSQTYQTWLKPRPELKKISTHSLWRFTRWNLDFINNTLYYINCEIMYADLYGDCIDGCFDGWLRVQSSRLLLVVYFDTSLQLEVITYNWSIDKMRILVCKTMC